MAVRAKETLEWIKPSEAHEVQLRRMGLSRSR